MAFLSAYLTSIIMVTVMTNVHNYERRVNSSNRVDRWARAGFWRLSPASPAGFLRCCRCIKGGDMRAVLVAAPRAHPRLLADFQQFVFGLLNARPRCAAILQKK
jgi:hypothetical protein